MHNTSPCISELAQFVLTFMGQLVASGDTVAAGVMGVIQDRMVNMLDAFARRNIPGPSAPATQSTHSQQATRNETSNPRKRSATGSGQNPSSAKKASTAEGTTRILLNLPEKIMGKVCLIGDSQLKRIEGKFLRSFARVMALGGHDVLALTDKLKNVTIDAAVEHIVVVLGTVDVLNNQYVSVPGRLADLVKTIRETLAFEGQLWICNVPMLPKYAHSVCKCNSAISEALRDLRCSVVDFANLMLTTPGDPKSVPADLMEPDGKHVTTKTIHRLLKHIAGQGVPATMVGFRKQKPPRDNDEAAGNRKSPLLRDTEIEGEGAEAAASDPGAEKQTRAKTKGQRQASKI